MKYHFEFFLIAVILLASACCSRDTSQSSKGLYYFTNFDQYYGFIEPYAVIKVNFAHSGDYVSKTDTSRNTCMIFSRHFKDITDKKLKKTEVTCWVYSEALYPECALVCSAHTEDNNGVKLHYFQAYAAQRDISDAKKWIQIHSIFYMSDSIPPEADVRVYFLNSSTHPVYVDDLAIQFEERSK